MNTKHTPGPWDWSRSAKPYFSINIHQAEGAPYTSESSDVAYIHEHTNGICATWVDRVDVAEANARLIAAAPELLEALQQCIARLEPSSSTWDKKAYLVGKAAIAKATGEKEEGK